MKMHKKINRDMRDSQRYLNQMALAGETPSEEPTPEYEDGFLYGLETAKRAILETSVPEIAKIIRKFVLDNYGKTELKNPSWHIGALAETITEQIKRG